MRKGAPKGNRFWELRSKHGRDKLFATPELLLEAAYEYFKWCENNPFLEVEQTKGSSKPYKDAKTSEVVWPSQLIELPKMRPFTMQGLCIYLGVNTLYFRDFEKGLEGKIDDMSKDFSQIIIHIHECIYNQKLSGAASGFLNANIIARELGLVEKSENKTEATQNITIHLESEEQKKLIDEF
jgi:hypothetical protein